MSAADVTDRIVVGIDGSASSLEALRWSTAFATPMNLPILVVGAFVPPYTEMSPPHHDELMEAFGREIEERWIPSAIGDAADVETEIRAGDARDVLVSIARPGDLLVLGRGGEADGPGVFHIGSVVEHSAHHLQTPLAVIPHAPFRPITRLAVAVDGSTGSRRAVEWVARIATPLEAEVLAIHVVERRWRPFRDERATEEETRTRVAGWTEPFAARGISVRSIVCHDVRPADGVLGVASARGCDLLVLGMQGLGGVTGVRVGGTAMRTLHRAQIPLVLVPDD